MYGKDLISVVTPVYNGSQFINDAYHCLCHQTYTDWEWVVVDDGSTDDTWPLLQQLAETDSRIRVFTQQSSGSAKYPRDRAVAMSKGKFVMPLDIDDILDDCYLSKLIERQQEAQADIVYSQMVFVDKESGKTMQTLPVEGFDTTKVYEGRDLVKYTMPEWEIGCGGGLYKREAWINMCYPVRQEPVWVYSDEVDERIYLIAALRVAFSDTRYYYLTHSASITNHLSLKKFHLLKNNKQLITLMEKNFGRDSEEFHRANLKAFYGWRSMMALYIKHHDQLADGNIAERHLREAFNCIDPCQLSRYDRFKFLNLSSFPLLYLLFCLKYSPKLIVEKAIQFICPTLYRKWFVRYHSECNLKTSIAPCYNHQSAEVCKPFVVNIYNSNVSYNELTDCLCGAVSTYLSCQETGRDYRLLFTHPFVLTDYLQPADYDWRVNPEEVCFSNKTELLVCESTTHSLREHQYQRRLFGRKLKASQENQVHVYSNASFCYDEDFALMFGQLFKPTPRLQARLEEVEKDIGGPYITVSARFCNLLDEFNNEIYSEPLPSLQQHQLIDRCIEQFAQLHNRHSNLKIVLCTDSKKIIERANKLDYIYCVLPIGNNNTHSYEYYEKTFLEFYIISKANKCYMLKDLRMPNNGLSFAATRMGGKKLIAIEL